MKLIKFKNITNPLDHNYNVFLKGKTAYLINYRYIVPLEMIDPRDMYAFHDVGDNFIDVILKSDKKVYWDTFKDIKITEYIDYKVTAELNELEDKNAYLRLFPDRKIPLDHLKRFRTWLATSLDVFTKKHEEVLHHILHYYMHDMYDDVIKWLTIFGDGSEAKEISKKPHCGCGKQSSGAAQSLLVCNSIDSYRTGIYNTMVDQFSNIQFWAILPESFLREMKLYIDNIVQSGLKVNINPVHTPIYAPCDCGKSDENLYMFKDILQRLSVSLHYIIVKDVTGHINFISKALKEWSSLLYEKMEWD